MSYKYNQELISGHSPLVKGDDYSEEKLIMKILGNESFFSSLSPALPDTGPRLPVPHSDGLII